jgi:hypothetical protein
MSNAETVRAIVEPTAKAAASAAIRDFVSQHPHFGPPPVKAEIPAPLKWAAIIVSAVLTMGVSGAAAWGVKTLNDLQLTVTRIDERQQQDTTGKQVDELKQRVAALESYHRERAGR